MLLYRLDIHTKYLLTQKVNKNLNKAKILQIITLFSEKVWQKAHNLLDENAIAQQSWGVIGCKRQFSTGARLSGMRGKLPIHNFV